MAANIPAAVAKPCRACGACDRDSGGKCKACNARRRAARREERQGAARRPHRATGRSRSTYFTGNPASSAAVGARTDAEGNIVLRFPRALAGPCVHWRGQDSLTCAAGIDWAQVGRAQQEGRFGLLLRLPCLHDCAAEAGYPCPRMERAEGRAPRA